MKTGLRCILGSALLAFLLLEAGTAHAIPSFARQTGLACSACHVIFPELTAFGRSFKLHGYTMTDVTREQSPELQEDYYPPLSAMLLVSLTALDTEVPGTQNWSVALPDQLSLFYAGRISASAGAFAQLTYTAVDDRFSMDNADLRLAGERTVGGRSLVYGLTLHNSPTVQDVWNSTPAWGFPAIASASAPSPTAAAQIDGPLAQQVAGLGAYALWDGWLYGELTLYRSSQVGAPQPLDAAAAGVIDGVAPYWRVALSRSWGEHGVEVGTYGLDLKSFPGDGSPPEGATDHFRDLALDAQYQYLTPRHAVTLHSTWIHERQDWDAGLPAGSAANPSDTLRTFRIDGTYSFDRTIGASLGYFATSGDADALRYPQAGVVGSANGSPDSRGWVASVEYLPWLNVKLSAQYVLYDRFNGGGSDYDGAGRAASDNNTLYISAWIMY